MKGQKTSVPSQVQKREVRKKSEIRCVTARRLFMQDSTHSNTNKKSAASAWLGGMVDCVDFMWIVRSWRYIHTMATDCRNVQKDGGVQDDRDRLHLYRSSSPLIHRWSTFFSSCSWTRAVTSAVRRSVYPQILALRHGGYRLERTC